MEESSAGDGTTRPRGGRAVRLLLLAIVACAPAVHLGVLDEWWRIDDPQLLLHAIRNSALESLFSPEHWRTLQTVSFQPLLSISLRLDHALFGASPAHFYAHHLAAIAAASLLLFALLRPVCGPPRAAAIAAIVTAGPAFAYASEFLMLRHYVEGAMFACAALVFWRPVVPGVPERIRDVAAALFYLLALLAKEVFAPLPVLFVADGLAERVPLRRLALRILPSAAVALLYLPWRARMLGGLGGYGGEIRPGSVVTILGGSLGDLLPSWTPVAAALAAAALAIGIAKRPRATLLLVAASAILVAIPLLGVSGLVEIRYGMVPLILATVLSGLAFSLLPPRAGWVAIALLAAVQLRATADLHARFDREQERGQQEGLYVWNAPATAPTLLADSVGWYITGVADLRRLEGRGEPPAAVFSLYALSAGDVDASRVVRVADDASAVVPISAALRSSVAADAALRDDTLPLAVDFRREDFALVWKLGPDDGSTFHFLTWPHYDEHAIPAEGVYRVPVPTQKEYFRVRRTRSDGRWTLSPVLEVPAQGAAATWSR